jgi:ethanolamine utilization protein EutN
MRVAYVVGNLTLSRCHPSYQGANLKLVVPLDTRDLVGPGDPAGHTIVAWDTLGAGLGNYVALAEGTQAAQPFLPDVKPIDAAAAGILDQLEVDQALVQGMLEKSGPG